ncbi:hypothetical protein [Streptomyces rhizosphaerihabitans]|nr:hypothetical protein [Streptomyces rhizosphaerihabitans]MCT9009190.1 hypothetical protein [Streptomyces rhizosphaerihabitans]
MTTAFLIAALGWEVDLMLWADAAERGPCHPGDDSHRHGEGPRRGR